MPDSNHPPKRLAAILAVAVAVGAVTLPTRLWAQPAPSAAVQPTVSGVGAVRCERVVGDLGGSGAAEHRFIYQGWSQGFLTAMNIEQSRQQSAVTDQSAMTAEAQWSFLSDYCLLHPDDLFVHAVASLVGSLNRTSRGTAPPQSLDREGQ